MAWASWPPPVQLSPFVFQASLVNKLGRCSYSSEKMTRFLHGKIHLKDFSRSSAARGGRDSGLSEHSAHRDDAASAATVAVSYSVKLLVGPGEGGGRAEAAAAAQALDPVFSRVARFYPLSLISKMPEREKQFLVLLTLKIRSKRPLQSPFEPQTWN